MQDIDIADLKRITELVFQKYQYDFRNYAMSSLKRRILRILELKKMNVDLLVRQLNEHPGFIHEFVRELTVNVTEMFRDPGFWRTLRQDVIPTIRMNQKQFRIWHAGCSSGEEVLTMCIILKELDMLQDVSIVATDLDTDILDKARAASCSMQHMELNERNYVRHHPGAKGLTQYYDQVNGKAVFHKDLLANVSFRTQDLVTGPVFSKFDLVLCRNVMIYFNQALQNDVLKKFHDSLFRYGYLCIGSKESLIWCDYANRFIVVNGEEKIYKKIKE